MPSAAGEFVTEMFDYDRGRQVTVYLPPDPPEAVVLTERTGSHGDLFWRREFPRMVAWAFAQ